ncbi:hypothetical protein BD309DRAFT_378066 [Dichomitus squalens]|nr:hypothetical protein BD309DRAFT_378066 [Dichomitus squalens]
MATSTMLLACLILMPAISYAPVVRDTMVIGYDSEDASAAHSCVAQDSHVHANPWSRALLKRYEKLLSHYSHHTPFISPRHFHTATRY